MSVYVQIYNIYIQINLIINKIMIIDTISVTCYKTSFVPRTRTRLTYFDRCGYVKFPLALISNSLGLYDCGFKNCSNITG